MPDLNKAHEREGEFDRGDIRHHLTGTPAVPGKATAGGAVAGGLLGAIIGGGAQATAAGAAAGAVAGPPGVVAGAAIGAALGAVIGAAAGYGADAADRAGELQSGGTGTLDANPAQRDHHASAARRSNLDSQMTAAEYVDDTAPPSQFPARPPDRLEPPEAR